MIAVSTVPGLGNNVTKPELGTKRLCASCNAKFYDLLKTPIVCPMCEAVFVLPKIAPARPRRGFESLPAVASAPVAVAPDGDDAAVTLVKADGETADGEKEADAGVPLLEEMDED